ncbi:hypothetical protein [Luteolibacter soli]|uniref:Uncharacterized protein n=1 Tax=Luteolibacter soli TaxID=3135280 RepID=A0ABU9AXX7_9BACT
MALHSSTLRAVILPLALLGALPSTASAQGTPQPGYPVISRVELLFSMVSHYNSISDRINFYNTYGQPQGSTNYASPHLVYEPIVTLYNPYNETLTMTRARVKISDPPVGFSFKKNDVYLRSEFASGSFLGLARFQLANESNPDARKTFTLLLTELKGNSTPGDPIKLLPGESKTFSAWVEPIWTWGLETAADYMPRSFFDWNASNDFTNRDKRTANLLGVEAVASRFNIFGSPNAGFQTDGLSAHIVRPPATLYSFEAAHNHTDSFVLIKLTDTINVQAKSMRTAPVITGPTDFQVDLLKGQTQNPTTDLVKSFPMSLAGIIQNNTTPVISRTFTAGDLLQKPADQTSGGKMPFASLVMIAKSRALRENRFYTTQPPGPPQDNTGNDFYELHFTEAIDFTGAHVFASDASLTAAPQIIGCSRVGNVLYIDFSGRPANPGEITWKVRGSNNLHDGFPDNLNSVTGIYTGQAPSGIYKAVVNITGHGDPYFVRIEE